MNKPVLAALLAFLFAFLTACGADNNDNKDGNGGEESDLPTTAFATEYQAADFNLTEEYDYWEIRRGETPNQPITEYQTGLQFDQADFDGLSQAQQQLLSNSVSRSGFSGACEPSFCPYYAVAIRGGAVTIIDSRNKWFEFLGEIDNEAELYLRLIYASDYQIRTTPAFYQAVEDGYLVVLRWDTLCQVRGEDLVKVYPDGRIEKIRELSREEYMGCA